MPYSVTIRRAISVACLKSLEAPVEIEPTTISSAARPPIRPAILSSNSSRDMRYRSSRGSCMVYPSAARPRGMIEILCTGSECVSRVETSPCPDSW